MEKLTIPPKSRGEWMQLIRGERQHSFQNLSLQIKLNVGRFELEAGRLSEEELLDEMYELCEKFSVASQKDLRLIFKHW